RILHRNGELTGDLIQQINLLGGKGSLSKTTYVQCPQNFAVRQEWEAAAGFDTFREQCLTNLGIQTFEIVLIEERRLAQPERAAGRGIIDGTDQAFVDQSLAFRQNDSVPAEHLLVRIGSV